MGMERVRALSCRLPKVADFFSGKTTPAGVQIPDDILLYCHDFNWPKTIISSRYMLIIPFVPLTYDIENQRYTLQPGQAAFVKPFLHRCVPALHKDYLRLIVSFEVPGDPVYFPRTPILNMTGEAWRHTEGLLRHYRSDNRVASSLALASLLAELSQNAVAVMPQKENSARIVRAMSLINQHLGESFGIKDIASRLEWSASHLRRRFREEVGISLGDYISRRRLDSAQRLLLDTTMSVSEVARCCGYDTIYSFSRFFKSSTGLSPQKYRQQRGNPERRI